jgi:hypothetical protein
MRIEEVSDLIEFSSGDDASPPHPTKVQLNADLLCLCDPPPLDDLLGFDQSVPFTVKSFVHSLHGVMCQPAQKQQVQSEDAIFAFQERLCSIVDMEIQKDDQVAIQGFPTKLNEYLHEKAEKECSQMSSTAIIPFGDTESINAISPPTRISEPEAPSIPQEDESEGDWIQVSKHANEDDVSLGPASALSNAAGGLKPHRSQDKQTVAASVANLSKRPKSSLHEHHPNPEATSRTRSDVTEQVTTRKSTMSRQPSRAKPAAASQHSKTKPPIPDAPNQHGRAKFPFSDIDVATPIQLISDIDVPTPKSTTAKSPFSDIEIATPKSVPATQPGRPKPVIAGTEAPTPKSTTANQHNRTKPAEYTTPKVAAPSHHGRPVSDTADTITPKSISTQQHGKSDTGATTPRSAEPKQHQSRPPYPEFITPKPTAAKTRPPTRLSEADTTTPKSITLRSKTPTNSDTITAKSSLMKTRQQAVDVCEQDNLTPKSASRVKTKAAQGEPTPAAKRRAATPLGAKSPGKKTGTMTPSKSENETGFDLCIKDMELILAAVPHEKPSMRQRVPAKGRPLAAALVAADLSEYSD